MTVANRSVQHWGETKSLLEGSKRWRSGSQCARRQSSSDHGTSRESRCKLLRTNCTRKSRKGASKRPRSWNYVRKWLPTCRERQCALRKGVRRSCRRSTKLLDAITSVSSTFERMYTCRCVGGEGFQSVDWSAHRFSNRACRRFGVASFFALRVSTERWRNVKDIGDIPSFCIAHGSNNNKRTFVNASRFGLHFQKTNMSSTGSTRSQRKRGFRLKSVKRHVCKVASSLCLLIAPFSLLGARFFRTVRNSEGGERATLLS